MLCNLFLWSAWTKMYKFASNTFTCTDESSFPQNSTLVPGFGCWRQASFHRVYTALSTGWIQHYIKSAGIRRESDVLNNRKLDNCLTLFIWYFYVIYFVCIVQMKCTLSLIASLLFFDVFVTGSYVGVVVLEYAHVCFLIYLQLQWRITEEN